jgi:signal transduction histidine kinase
MRGKKCTVYAFQIGMAADIWTGLTLIFVFLTIGMGLILKKTSRALQEAVRRKDELANTLVSSEFKNPISSIQMYAELLLRNRLANPPGSPNEENVHAILRSSERMRRSLRDLQDAKKMENKSFALSESMNTLPSIIDDTLEAFKTATVERRIRLKVIQPATIPDIVCDRQRLIQALSHLVQAAIQSSASDKEVRVTVEDVFPHVKISIRGEGRIGLEELQRGLGWNVAKTVVESHKGALGVFDSALVVTVPFKTEKKSRLLRVV